MIVHSVAELGTAGVYVMRCPLGYHVGLSHDCVVSRAESYFHPRPVVNAPMRRALRQYPRDKWEIQYVPAGWFSPESLEVFWIARLGSYPGLNTSPGGEPSAYYMCGRRLRDNGQHLVGCLVHYHHSCRDLLEACAACADAVSRFPVKRKRSSRGMDVAISNAFYGLSLAEDPIGIISPPNTDELSGLVALAVDSVLDACHASMRLRPPDDRVFTESESAKFKWLLEREDARHAALLSLHQAANDFRNKSRRWPVRN